MAKEAVQPQDKYVLRLPDGMRDRLKAAAEAENRSMNAEIVSRLENTFSNDASPNLSDAEVDELLGLLDRLFSSLGTLAKDKDVATKLSDARVFSSAYELGAYRRGLLQMKWHRDFAGSGDLQRSYSSAEAYVSEKFAELDAAVFEHGMSAGRTGKD